MRYYDIDTILDQLIQDNLLLSDRALWIGNFTNTMELVKNWCEFNINQINEVYVIITLTKTIIYISPKSQQYDLGLSERLVGLGLDINKSGIGYIEVLQVLMNSPHIDYPRAIRVWPQ